MSKNRDDATLRVYAALEEYERALDVAARRDRHERGHAAPRGLKHRFTP